MIEAVVLILCLFLGGFLLGGSVFYPKLGMFKFFYHDILNWHVPIESNPHIHSTCKYCEKDIVHDSFGIWYLEDEM